MVRLIYNLTSGRVRTGRPYWTARLAESGSLTFRKRDPASKNQTPTPRKIRIKHFLKKLVTGWRDGSAVKSTGRSFRGPGFNSQQLTWQLTAVCNSSSRRSDTLIAIHIKLVTNRPLQYQDRRDQLAWATWRPIFCFVWRQGLM